MLHKWVWIDCLGTAQSLQDAILLFHLSADFLRETFRCDQVADAEAAAARLVFVCGADASGRRSDFSIAKQLFGGRLNSAMIGKNQMAPVGNEKPSGHFDAGGGDGFGFFKESDRIQNHASADNADYSVMKNSGRNQVQDMAILSERDRVAGIVSALITGHTVEFLERMSTILPLPSSPHWRPTIAKFIGEMSGEVLVERLRDDFLSDGANNLFLHLTILEKEQRWNSADTVLGGCGSVGVDIEFADFDAALVLFRNGFDGWRQCPAWPAPRCPEIDQYGDGGFGYLGIKISVGDFNCVGAHGFLQL